MSYSEIILLAFALSIDACVVSFSYGMCIEKKHRHSSLTLGFTTGLFQALMPLGGVCLTDLVKNVIQPYSKFIVFLIFMYLGITFIREAIKNEPLKKLCVTFKALILIGIATSIDAFSAGISLSLTESPLKFSIISIGLITFISSLIGYWCGHYLKIFSAKYLQIVGGLTLIGLAVSNCF
ncbi:MAG: manganese efflux pump [Candidatus Gastranaerophilales bacterium]|nr:manganese efflux pump [Candidatus Gastranaerophilales bacterium]